MKVAILGAGGNIGQRISKEAASRNYELTLITSKPLQHFGFEDETGISVTTADIFNTEALAATLKGHDVVISAYAPPHDDTSVLTGATKSLLAAVKSADIRLIAVGGAGSLFVTETLQLVDSPDFPEAHKSIAEAHRVVLESLYYPEKEVDWTNVSPSAYIFEGEKTNTFRIGENALLLDAEGNSSISMEDFAVGIVDEIADQKFNGKRFTIGY